MPTPKPYDPMDAVRAYRSKTPEQAAADKLRQGVAQRVTAAGGVPTQARITAIINKTAATKAAEAKAAAAQPKTMPKPVREDIRRNILPVEDPSRYGRGVVLSGPTLEGRAAAAQVEMAEREAKRKARVGTPDAGDTKTPAGWSRGNKTGWGGAPLPPGRGEIGADGKPVKMPTSPFAGKGGRRGTRRRGNRMPVPRTGG